MREKLKEVDDELVIAIPQELVQAAGLSRDATVNVQVSGASVVISLPDPTLDELLERIDGPPPPGVWDDIEPRGSDVW